MHDEFAAGGMASVHYGFVTGQAGFSRVVAIKNAVLSRRMPPWGAVKGFGEFRNDHGLTQEQVELVSASADFNKITLILEKK